MSRIGGDVPIPKIGTWIFIKKPTIDLISGRKLPPRMYVLVSGFRLHSQGNATITGYIGNGQATNRAIFQAIGKPIDNVVCQMIRIPVAATLDLKEKNSAKQ